MENQLFIPYSLERQIKMNNIKIKFLLKPS